MKKTLGSLKVDDITITNMKSAIKKYNLKNIFPVSEAEFRRLGIELLSQLILQDIEIPIRVTK